MKSLRSKSTRCLRSGLTFIEVLLSIALLTMMLGTATHVLFVLAHVWHESEEEPRFVRHMEGVTGFLSSAFERSPRPSATGEQRHARWQPLPGGGGGNPTFSFKLADGDPFFVTPFLPLPPVTAWLLFDGRSALSLVWHVPPRLTERRMQLHRTLLSSWVKDVEIGYLDKDRNLWEFESMADGAAGAQRAEPGALRIVFEKEGRTFTRYVRLDRQEQNALFL